MYQPRRATGPAVAESGQESPQAAAGAPRRGARTWYLRTADRIGAAFLGLAVTATAGALFMAGPAAAARSPRR